MSSELTRAARAPRGDGGAARCYGEDMAQPESWLDVDLDHGFGLDHLPLGVTPEGVVVRLGDAGLVLAPLVELGVLRSVDRSMVEASTLGPLLGRGPSVLSRLRGELQSLATGKPHDGVARWLQPVAQLRLLAPIRPRTYVDFYASEAHASNAGRIFRPSGPPLPPQWRLEPIAYHGRASTVLPSGEAVQRPWGLIEGAAGPAVVPSTKLDFEAEVGFVVGQPSPRGTPLRPAEMSSYVAGVVLANDWSARDIQALETFPLGPFNGKSFATSIATWLTPLEALRAARVAPPLQDPPPAPYLVDDDPWCLDLRLRVELNGTVIATPPARTTYWTPGQMLAQLTVSGAPVECEDLFCSGTVSGPARAEVGSLLEATWGGREPIRVGDGSERTWLLDGDDVRITATAPGAFGGTIALGEVWAAIRPARASWWNAE